MLRPAVDPAFDLRRGKFDLAFMSTQLVISSAKQEFCIPYGTIRNVVVSSTGRRNL